MHDVGTQAPDFSVQDHHGNTVSLKDFAGKKVVLWFYPKADTPGCTMEGQGFRDDYQKFQGKNSVILGVSLDGVDNNKAFAEKYSFPFQLLCDLNREKNQTIVMITHNPEAAEMGNRVIEMLDGEVKSHGTVAELVEPEQARSQAR